MVQQSRTFHSVKGAVFYLIAVKPKQMSQWQTMKKTKSLLAFVKTIILEKLYWTYKRRKPTQIILQFSVKMKTALFSKCQQNKKHSRGCTNLGGKSFLWTTETTPSTVYQQNQRGKVKVFILHTVYKLEHYI